MNRNPLIWTVAIVVYAMLPFVFWEWLLYQLESGAFPTDADSIGIPMAGFLLLWLLGIALTAVLLGVLRHFRFKRRLK